jgi:glycosyltransferase involved in cell wall biosynthesis
VKRGDQAIFAKRIELLLDDAERQKRIGEEGRRFVMQYDLRKIAQAELNAIQGLFEAHFGK